VDRLPAFTSDDIGGGNFRKCQPTARESIVPTSADEHE
jgi:hypothetical protein